MKRLLLITILLLAVGVTMATFRPITSNNSQGSNNSQINDMVRSLNKESQTKVFKGPNNVNALITGKLPNDLGYGFQFSDSDNVPRIIGYIDASNNPVFKISETGVDVTTATNDQLNFNSTQNVFKIVMSGTVTINVPDSMIADQVASETITHDLGYKPAIMAFITGGTAYGTSPDQMLMMPFSSRYVTAGTIRGFFYTDAYTTDTTAVFRHTNETTVTDTTGGSVTIKYYLLQETAN